MLTYPDQYQDWLQLAYQSSHHSGRDWQASLSSLLDVSEYLY